MVIVFFQSKTRYVGARMQRARSMQTYAEAAPANGTEMTRAATPSRHVSDRVGASTNQWTDWWRGGAWGEGIRYWRR
jgi:hypothetical protein